jgi:hypothetical protein
MTEFAELGKSRQHGAVEQRVPRPQRNRGAVKSANHRKAEFVQDGGKRANETERGNGRCTKPKNKPRVVGFLHRG